MQDLTPEQFAEKTGRNPETIRRLARAGRLPGAYRIGGRWYVRHDALERLREESVKTASSQRGGSQ